MPKTRTLVESFHRIAIKRGPDECWPWPGSRNSRGYGRIARRENGRTRYTKASHVGWEIANGKPWPVGKIARHSCDYPPCVNGAHISPGTQVENGDDLRRRLTHCKRGHPFDEANTKITMRATGTLRRSCRKCNADPTPTAGSVTPAESARG